MKTDSSEQDNSEPVYSRAFNGTPRLYWIASILSGLYLGIGIYLTYGLTRYYLAGDEAMFSLKALAYLVIFCALYIPFSYRTMMKTDGMNLSGSGWAQKEAKVTLIERKEHRRFG